MRKESIYYKNRVKPVLDRIVGLTYERVELKTGKPGMPDIIYSHGGTGFIEMKYNDDPAHIDLSLWTKAQRRFARNYDRVLLFVGNPECSYVLDPSLIDSGVKRLPINHMSIMYQWGRLGVNSGVIGHVSQLLYWRHKKLPPTI